MNRLTVRSTGVHTNYLTKYNSSVLCSEMTVPQRKECMEKLAAYEDTGLEPEEINKYFDGYVKEINRLRDIVTKYDVLKHQGRLIILPCKEKDIIYILDVKGKIHECEVYNITTNIYANTDKKSVYWKGFEIKDDLFGKTVFLTQEEAENALKE